MQPQGNKKGYRTAVAILSRLTKDEQKSLNLFVASPYCTNLPAGSDCPRFVLLLLKLIQKTPKKVDDESHVFRLMYPDQEFSPNKYHRMMSDANVLLKKFIISEQAAKAIDDNMALLYQIQYWRQKKEKDQFEKIQEQIEKKQVEIKKWEGPDLYWKYLTEIENVEYRNEYNQHKSDVNLKHAIQSLDEFYLVERAFITCCLLTQNQITELDLPVPLFPVNEEYFRWFFNKPLGRFLANLLICIDPQRNDNDQVIAETTALLKQFEPEISDKFVEQFEYMIGNYFTRQINRGRNEYTKLLFELFKKRVENKKIYHDGTIIANEFQGIVACALKAKELDWAIQFIECHKDRITGSNHPENAYQYNYCDYLFHAFYYAPKEEKETKKANLRNILPLLNQANFHDMHYKRAARILEIKCIYEENSEREYDFLFDKLQALRTFISRDEYLPADKKVGYNLFAKVITVLLRNIIEFNANIAQISALKEEVLNADFVVSREWLIDKINNMLPSNKP